MSEEWRPVVGYEGRYEVSNTGQVRGIERMVDYVDGRRTTNPGGTKNVAVGALGYYTVTLRANGHRRVEYVHRIVAKAFIPNPMQKRTVNHKDGNKLNNHVSNLEWATHSENNRHAVVMGLRKTKNCRHWEGKG